MSVEDRVGSGTEKLVSSDVATGDWLAAFPILLDTDVDRAVHNAERSQAVS